MIEEVLDVLLGTTSGNTTATLGSFSLIRNPYMGAIDLPLAKVLVALGGETVMKTFVSVRP